jgi:hypothetical protein
MAVLNNNLLIKGLSGSIGNMTFRQRGGETIVSRKRRPGSASSNAIQMKNQERFMEANMYAKNAIKDPVLKALYRSVATGGQTAYNIAVSDAYKGPEIKSVSIGEYHGVPGDVILIKADIVLVVKMEVMIVNADGVVVEEGAAAVAGKGWKYVVSMRNEEVRGSKIIVTAANRVGKGAKKEVDFVNSCI